MLEPPIRDLASAGPSLAAQPRAGENANHVGGGAGHLAAARRGLA